MKKSSPKYYQIDIPMKPYARQFCTALYGNDIHADKYSTLGMYCMLALEKNLYDNRHPYQQTTTTDYTDTYTLHISKWQFERLGFELQPEHIQAINKFIEQQFQESLYLWCKNKVAHDDKRYKGYKESILSFAAHYQLEIDEHINYDTLKKIEYRYRERIEKKV